MRGYSQHTREAKPMGRINLDENEFDSFSEDYPFVKFGRKGGIFSRMKECMTSVKKAGLTGSAKKSFIKGCMKNKGKADEKRIKEKIQKIKDKNLKNKKAFWKQVEEAKDRQSKPQQRLADPSLTAPKVDDAQVQADTKKKKMMKLLLYGGIGVVVLIIGIKLIKK
jgi:hypothetical protein